MRKLLDAGFSRLYRQKLFWLTAACVLLGAVVVSLNVSESANAAIADGAAVTMDRYFYEFMPSMGLFYAAFISLFLGIEYTDGTIRNKLAVGHARRSVYLSNYIVCLTACAAFLALALLGSVPGLFLVGPLSGGAFLYSAAVCVLAAAVFAAIFTCVSMHMTSRAGAVVVNFAIWLVLLMAASAVNDRLAEPEMNGGMMLTINGFETIDPTPNPLYVSGALRAALECLLDLLPTGQMLQLADGGLAQPVRAMAFSLVLAVGITVLGAAFFRRKDVK